MSSQKKLTEDILFSYDIILENKNLIREAKVHQIPSVMQTSQKDGMVTMEKSIEILTQSGAISGAID